MCLGVLVSAGAHTCMCDFTWRLDSSVGVQDTVHPSEVGSLTALELATSAGWLLNPRDQPISVSPAQEWQAYTSPGLCFLMWFWVPNPRSSCSLCSLSNACY